MKNYEIYKRKADRIFDDFTYYGRTPIYEQAVTICKHLNERGYDASITLIGGERYENGAYGYYPCENNQ